MTLSTVDSTGLETSDSDSVSARKPSSIISGRADEPPTNLSRSPDNQIVLYPQDSEDTTQADLFEKWWDLTPWGVKLATQNKTPKWGQQSTKKESAWQYFSEGADIMQGDPKVICKLCGYILVHPTPKNLGTKAFWNHLTSDRCRKKADRPLLLQKLLKKVKPNKELAYSLPRFNQQAFNNYLLSFILEANLPFRLIEHDSFRKLFLLCRPNLQIPHRTFLKTTLIERYTAMQNGILRDLPSSRKLSLALDCWTSPNNYAFLAITCYFITDDWNYVEALLAFKPLRGVHSGEKLADYVMKTLHFHNITKRLLAITADNAKNNNSLRRQLHGALRREGIKWDYQQGTIRCMSHTLQLCVDAFNAVLKIQPSSDDHVESFRKQKYDHITFEDSGYNNVVLKIRATAIAVRSSPQQNQKFLDSQNPADRDFFGRIPVPRPLIKVGLIRDVKHRWGSSYNMFARAWELKKAIQKWIKVDGNERFKNLSIQNSEWKKVGNILKCLQPFSQLIQGLGTTLYVSVHSVFRVFSWLFDEIEKIERDLKKKKGKEKAEAAELLEALDAAKEKLIIYYGRTSGIHGRFFNLATILDPSIRTSLYQDSSWDDWRDGYLNEFRDYFHTNYAHLASRPQTASTDSDPDPVGFNIATIGRPVSKPSKKRSELDSYLNDDIVFENTELIQDPLKMWKQIEHKYPTVAMMAKDILSIPASGVGVERIFNTARDVCHYRRNRLNSDTIEMIMLVKWYEKLGLWTPEEGYDSFNQKEEVIEADELPMDEQSVTIIQEEVEWETEDSDESILDVDED